MNMFRSVLAILCAFIFCDIINAQEKIASREVLSLDKGWRFHKGDIPFPVIKGHNETYRHT